MTEEEAPEPGPDEKVVLKKEAMEIVGVSLRTFNRIRDQLKEQFSEEPLLIWHPVAKHMVSLYSMNDIRKMVQLKAVRVRPGRKPKDDPEPEEELSEDEKYQDFLSQREE